jgi:hypothetical protein
MRAHFLNDFIPVEGSHLRRIRCKKRLNRTHRCKQGGWQGRLRAGMMKVLRYALDLVDLASMTMLAKVVVKQ